MELTKAESMRMRLIAVIIALLWGVGKFLHIYDWGYTSDSISMLQMSRGIWEGRPLLFENAYGDHRLLHSYYTLPLFAPLSIPFGVYGLALGALLIWSYAAYLALRRTERPGLILAWILGPFAFWLFDDQYFGFHVEATFAPLAVIFGVALVDRRSVLASVSGALLVLTREEGALLAMAVHTLVVVIRQGGAIGKAVALPIAGWLMVFLLGLVTLVMVGGGMSSRAIRGVSGLALLANGFTPEMQHNLVAFLTIVAGLVAGILFSVSLRTVRWWIVLSLPLLLVIAVSEAHSLPGSELRSLVWAPRNAAWLGFTFAAVVVADRFNDRSRINRPRAFELGFVFAQIALLIVSHGYVLGGPPFARGMQVLFTEAEQRCITCMAQNLPLRSPLVPSGAFFMPFHQHDIVWEDRRSAAFQAPRVAVCDMEARLSPVRLCDTFAREQVAGGWVEARCGALRIAGEVEFAEIIARCANTNNS